MDAAGTASKRCSACREVKSLDQFQRETRRTDGRRSYCKACATIQAKKRYAETRDAVAEYNRRRYAANPERAKAEAVAYAAGLKAAVLAHYGETCSCCGTTSDLTIDHINGDGRQWRQQTFGNNDAGGAPVYRWIIANGFPDDLQVLCRSCNRSKGDGAACHLDHMKMTLLRLCGHSWDDRRPGRGDRCAGCHRDAERARHRAPKATTDANPTDEEASC